MRKLLFYTFMLTIVTSLSSCMPQKDDDFKIITKGISNIPEFSIDTGNDLGYIVLGSNTRILTITVYNKSDYPYKNMSLTIDTIETAGMTFSEDPDTNDKNYPGYEGTCTNELAPKQQCTITIQYNPIIEGHFTQKLIWSYTNLLEAQNRTEKINLITAVPASLTFTNDTTYYNLGIFERTDITTDRIQDIEIKNAGGLPASAINISILNQTGSPLSYQIIENNCPVQLFKDEVCQIKLKYQPQNYKSAEYPSAPDSDTRLLEYKSKLQIVYESDMEHNEEHLNASFTFLSTGIEGYMTFTGQDTFSFDEKVVGTEQTSTIAIANTGYKEAILRKFHVIHNGSRVAECTFDDTNDYNNRFLTCKDPATKIPLSLDSFPFLIKDNQSCFSEEQKLNYTRLPDTSLSDQTLRLVPGKDISNPLSAGETCTFDITFHPSVKYIAGQPEDKGKEYWKDIDFSLEYDSTWKDRIVFYNTPGIIEKLFTVEEAFYEYSAKLDSLLVRYNGEQIDNTPTASLSSPYIDEFPSSTMPSPFNPITYNKFFITDFGNISLVSSSLTPSERSQYKQEIQWSLQNNGPIDATDIILKTFATQASTSPIQLNAGDTINSYYSVTSNNCSTVAYGTKCKLLMSFLPMSDSKDSMFTNQEGISNGNPYGFRRFLAYYKDGSDFEDTRNADGTFVTRSIQATELRIKAALVSKGLLTFYDPSTTGDWASDNTKDLISGNQATQEIVLRNIGTGDITDLYVANLSDANDISSQNTIFSAASAPYNAINYSDAATDCLNIIDPTGTSLPGWPSSNFTNNASFKIAADGGTCTLRLNVGLTRSPSFLLRKASYLGGSEGEEAKGRTNLRSLSASERLDWRSFPYSSSQDGGVLLGFKYKPDPAESTVRKILSSNGQGTYVISSKFNTPSRLHLTRSTPYISSTVYKPERTIDETEAGKVKIL